jgi:DNA-binding beta-propeller fold protein YncE
VKSPLSVDSSAIYNSNYYINDRSIAGVHVVDVKTNSQVATIDGFFKGRFDPNGTVLEVPGPEGMLVVAKNNELWVGDADGSVKVINMFSNKILANITTGSIHRTDEFAHDPDTDTVIVTNNEDPIPFIAVISSKNRPSWARSLLLALPVSNSLLSTNFSKSLHLRAILSSKPCPSRRSHLLP